MCEYEPPSKSRTRSLLEGMEGEEKETNLIASFLHPVVRSLGSPTKVSGQKRWRILQIRQDTNVDKKGASKSSRGLELAVFTL
jgi:hypothetical protein